MQQFLAERRINIGQFEKKKASDSTETVAQRNKRLRDLAIQKREAEMTQLRAEDYFASMAEENAVVAEALHEGCFTKCAQKTDLMFLTVQEGLCFRNCLNKFNNWYPRLEEQTRDAAYRTYNDMTTELAADLRKQ